MYVLLKISINDVRSIVWIFGGDVLMYGPTWYMYLDGLTGCDVSTNGYMYHYGLLEVETACGGCYTFVGELSLVAG